MLNMMGVYKKKKWIRIYIKEEMKGRFYSKNAMEFGLSSEIIVAFLFIKI
jgi:ribosomal protein S19